MIDDLDELFKSIEEEAKRIVERAKQRRPTLTNAMYTCSYCCYEGDTKIELNNH